MPKKLKATAPKPVAEPEPADDFRNNLRELDWPTAEARPFALNELRRALALWRAEKVHQAEARALGGSSKFYSEDSSDKTRLRYEEGHMWELFIGAASDAVSDAEDRVIALTLMMCLRIEYPSEVKKLASDWEPVMFELDGEHLVVSRNEPEDFDYRPRLTIVAAAEFDSAQFGVGPGPD
jgi:hypothetical protein